jgi:hypothetical protein
VGHRLVCWWEGGLDGPCGGVADLDVAYQMGSCRLVIGSGASNHNTALANASDRTREHLEDASRLDSKTWGSRPICPVLPCPEGAQDSSRLLYPVPTVRWCGL